MMFIGGYIHIDIAFSNPILTNTTLFVLIFAQRALRVISRVFIFAHHELSIISSVLIFAQGHFARNFFSIIYLKQMKREAKEYGI